MTEKRPAAHRDYLESSLSIKVKRLSSSSVMPVKGTSHAAGFDLFAAAAVTVPACAVDDSSGIVRIGTAVVPTGLSFEIPAGHYGRIVERSGMAFRQGLHSGAGVIDADYRGEVRILVYNFGPEPIVIEQGMRFAQMIIERIGEFEMEEAGELSLSARGDGGFGSTGLFQQKS